MGGDTRVLREEHLSREVSRHFEEGILGLELLFMRGKKKQPISFVKVFIGTFFLEQHINILFFNYNGMKLSFISLPSIKIV